MHAQTAMARPHFSSARLAICVDRSKAWIGQRWWWVQLYPMPPDVSLVRSRQQSSARASCRDGCGRPQIARATGANRGPLHGFLLHFPRASCLQAGLHAAYGFRFSAEFQLGHSRAGGLTSVPQSRRGAERVCEMDRTRYFWHFWPFPENETVPVNTFLRFAMLSLSCFFLGQ